jgi:Flp pilus assembly protein TadD/RNA polymerase subunit RPABC4/transcription elongation factor Spt4
MSSSAAKCPQCGKPAESQAEAGDLEGELDDLESSLQYTGENPSAPDSIFMCPGCGAFIASSATKCPQCGIAMDDSDDVPAAEAAAPAVKSMEPEKVQKDGQVLALCIACGAFSMEGLERCPGCNALMGKSAQPDKPGLPKEDVELLDMLVSAEPQISASKPSAKSRGAMMPYSVAICGVCGAFVKPDSERCGVCATLLTEGTMKYPEIPEILPEVLPYSPNATGILKGVFKVHGSPETLPSPRFDETNIDVCTVCGAFMQKGGSKCPVCNTSRSEMPAYEPLNLDFENGPAVNGLVVCPRCGNFSREGEGSCGKCGAALPAELPRFDGKERDTLSEAEKVLIDMLGANGLIDTMPEESQGSELDICVNCGAFMSAKTTICPMCGTSAGSDVDDLFRMLKTEDDDAIIPSGSSECPFCGADVGTGSAACGECGFVFAQESKSPAVPERELEEMESELETLDFMAEGLLDDDLGAPGKDKGMIVDSKRKPAERDRELDELQLEKAPPKKNKDAFSAKTMPTEDMASEIEGLENMLVEADLAEQPVSEKVQRKHAPDKSAAGVDGFELYLLDEIESESGLANLDESAPDIRDTIATKRVNTKEVYTDANLDGAILEIESVMRESPEPEMMDDPDTVAAEENPDGELEMAEAEIDASKQSDVNDGSDTDAQLSGEPEDFGRQDTESGDSEGATVHIPEPFPESPSVPESEPGEQGEKPSALVPHKNSDAIPAWKEPVLLNLLIMNTGFLLCVFLISSFLFPDSLQVILIAFFQPVVLLAYVFSRGVEGLASLERRSTRWIAPFTVSASLFPLTIMVADGSTMIFMTLFAMALMMSGLGSYVAPKGWRKRALWAASTVTLITFATMTLTDARTLSTQSMLAVTTILLGAACAEAMLDYARHKSLDLAIARGDARYTRNDYARAAQAYDDAITQMKSRTVKSADPVGLSYDIPWSRKGVALVLSGEVKEGIKCLQMALKINPSNAITWINLGNAMTKLGKHREAAAAFDNAIVRDPKQEIAWNNKGNALARQGRYIDALRCYNSAIKLNPRYHDVWINKGYVLAKLGKFDEAARCVSAVKSQPTLADA